MKSKAAFVAYTGVFLALLLAVQLVTMQIGQLIAGSLVNFILITAYFTAGRKVAIVAGIIAPFFALLTGAALPIPVVPVISLGNCTLILIYSFIFGDKLKINRHIKSVLAVAAGALLKNAVLILGVLVIVAPLFHMSDGLTAALSVKFGFSQTLTAVIGGSLSAITAPHIKNVLNKK